MINVSTIAKSFDTLFQTLRKPAPIISGLIMLCAMAKRPGLSCIVSTSNVLQDMAKRGVPTEDLPDGSKNLMNEVVASVVCEMIRAIKEDANIQMSMAPGSLSITASGGNAGGPVTCLGTNTTFSSGVGLIQ